MEGKTEDLYIVSSNFASTSPAAVCMSAERGTSARMVWHGGEMICDNFRLSNYALARNGGGLFNFASTAPAAGCMSARAWDERAHGVEWNLQRPMDL